MPAPKWTHPEQEEFLKAENENWDIVKSGPGTLQSFYTRTAITFLEKWPETPDAGILKMAGGDPKKAQELAEARVHKVSVGLCSLDGPLSPAR